LLTYFGGTRCRYKGREWY